MSNMDHVYEITRRGNPAKPEGEAGKEMLARMNENHFPVTSWALEFWKIRETDRILDIGCGSGLTLHRISEQAPAGKLTGLDYSEVSVSVASRTNAADVESGKMRILHASVENMPLPDNSFDKIITVESFYFWPNPAENLKEVFRVLDTGGEFLLVADIYGKEGLSEPVLENIREFHLFNPTPDEFRALFRQAGFSEISVETKEGTDWICIKGTKA